MNLTLNQKNTILGLHLGELDKDFVILSDTQLILWVDGEPSIIPYDIIGDKLILNDIEFNLIPNSTNDFFDEDFVSKADI